MRLFFSLLIITLCFGCNETQKTTNNKTKNSLDIFSLILKGKEVNKKFTSKSTTTKSESVTAHIFYTPTNNKVKEMNIHLLSKEVAIYTEALNFYNLYFKTSKTDSIFNSWQTDSTEFILYKNSDSSILVNIFNRI